MKRNTITAATVITVLSYLAFGPLQVAKPEPQPAQSETAAVQATLDRLNAAVNKLAARVSDLTPANPAIVTATSLGCKADDEKFDNGPLIQAALDKGLGVLLDSGGIYSTSPLRTKPGTASPIMGASASFRHSPACRTGLMPFAPNQTHIIEISGQSPEGAGHGQVVRDLYIQGTPTCDGIRVHGGDAISIENVIVRGCKTGIAIKPTIRLYALSIRGASLYGNDVGISVDNATNICSTVVSGVAVNAGRIGVNATGWKRGLTLQGVVCEGQTEACMKFEDAKASLIGCYLESTGDIPGIRAKGSRINIMDTSVRRISHDGLSQMTWIGDNMQAGTLDY
jgi:hypothetical protein